MRKIAAGNWKMNLGIEDAVNLFEDLNDANYPDDVEMIVFPSSIYLELFVRVRESVAVGSQNVSQFVSGAYTGEVSAKQLASIGVEYCLVGHSERRDYFGESSEVLTLKIKRLLEEGITPVYCFGEPKENRESNNHEEFVSKQLEEVLFNFNEKELEDLVLAYEPVWAIGTGLTATKEEAQSMHAFVRKALSTRFSIDFVNKVPILYGGSVKPENATDLFSSDDINGGLVGGASLKEDSFIAIARSF